MTGYLVQKRGLVTTWCHPVTISVLAIAVYSEILVIAILPRSPLGQKRLGFSSCKTRSFDASNHSFKRVNAEPVTFGRRGLLWTRTMKKSLRQLPGTTAV